MGETISTDGNAVIKFTSDVLSATSNIDFKPTNSINTSTSPATDELKTLISSFQQTISSYKTCIATEVKNVQAVHNAIEETDKKIKDSIATTMQA
ncbi:TIGR04197 family type VII secretion effector [Enterococcus plantarum]|uniref:TIGR04197 family type VII secretion effector n=1 Tax=Enterococcus plantarum TaxID=1077675 RepID=UPI001A8EF385|nr:TIGR04197 family type VII secretion effector [Enterococcus plantarum]MBO0421443.1 TIGR04197 family type VII secretion effector [Enterococcus plantarum]